jgi:hypothetical protein
VCLHLMQFSVTTKGMGLVRGAMRVV